MPRRWGLGVLVLAHRSGCLRGVARQHGVYWVCLPIDSNVAPVVPLADVSNPQGLKRRSQPPPASRGAPTARQRSRSVVLLISLAFISAHFTEHEMISHAPKQDVLAIAAGCSPAKHARSVQDIAARQY
jgi:hypothetical protein